MIEEIYLIRHAQPDRAQPIAYNVPPGPPLTPIGREEALQLAEWLVGRSIEHLFASPFERTTATVGPVAERLNLDVTFANALKEGAPGESLAQIRVRVAEMLTQLDDSPLRCVGLVTHGACVLGLLKHTTNDRIDLAKHVYDHGNHAPTAGVWHGLRTAQGWRWELAFKPLPELSNRTTTEPQQSASAMQRDPLTGAVFSQQQRDEDWAKA